MLRGGLDKAQNPIYQSFVDYSAEEAFWAMIRQGCGYAEEEPNLGQLAIHLLLTASTRTLRPEFLAGLERFLSIPHQAYCYELVSEWLHSDDLQQLYDVARYVEDEAHLPQRLEKLTVDDLATTECFPCINEIILSKLMTEISDHIIDVDVITKTVENVAPVSGTSTSAISTRVCCKWPTCRSSSKSTPQGSIPRTQSRSGKNMRRTITGWTPIIDCSI